jgi:hypothetical protein
MRGSARGNLSGNLAAASDQSENIPQPNGQGPKPKAEGYRILEKQPTSQSRYATQDRENADECANEELGNE